MSGGRNLALRPAGPGARGDATARAAQPGAAAAARPAPEGREGMAFARRA